MAIYNFFNGSIEGQMVPPKMEIGTNQPVILRNIVDLSTQALNAGDGDIGEVLDIPANTTVLECGIRIITSEAANGTVDLGVTGVNADQWGDALGLSAAEGTIVGMLAAPLYFDTADTIDIVATIDGADVDLSTGVFEVFAVCFKSIDSY